MNRDLLTVDSLSKRFSARGFGRGGFTAVKNASFSVGRNTMFGLVGESGCGKTTLARSVLFLDPPTSGRVVFDGNDLSSLSWRQMRRFRSRMQIVFQDPNGALNPKLRLRTSLAEGLRNLNVPPRQIQARIGEAAEEVGVSESHLDRFPHEFSGGQKQRLVIARALTMKPEFLVMDEPVSNLDVSVQAQIINLLMDLKERLSLTYLFISHDLNLVSYLCDVIAVMYSGRILEIGPAERIIKEPLHVYTRHLFSSSARVVDVEDSDRDLSALGRFTANPHTTAADSATGCAFSSYCSLANEKCMIAAPEFEWIDENRGVACHLSKK